MRNRLIIGIVACAGAIALTSTGAVADRLITGRDIRDGSIAAKDLRPAVQRKLDRVGVQGPQGPAGDPATDRFGKLEHHFHMKRPVTWTAGGFDASQAGSIATLQFAPGTYLVTIDALFTRAEDAGPSSPILQVHFLGDQDAFGQQQFFRALTSPFPPGDSAQQNASTSRVVTVSKAASARVVVWGSNESGTATGSGDYLADVDVSAVRID